MPASLRDNATQVHIASLFAKAVYGDEDVGEKYDKGVSGIDQGKIDDYQGYLNDSVGSLFVEGNWTVLPGNLKNLTGATSGKLLYKDGFNTLGLNLAEQINAGTAEALIAEGTVDGCKTLVYAVRGTNGEDKAAAAAGQSYTNPGNTGQYKLHQEWLDAAIRYVRDNDIKSFIVTGHSMGGGVVDQFAIKDAGRVPGDVDLKMITFGSAGIAPMRYEDLGSNFSRGEYIGISHSQDPVTFPESAPGNNFVSIRRLDDNWHPSGDIYRVDRQNTDPTISDLGFGGEHSKALYFETAKDLAADPALLYVNGRPNVVFGLNNAIVKFGTTPGPPPEREIRGTDGKDYMLGRIGGDKLVGLGGNDTLSGGPGADSLYGSDGNDTLHGGDSSDSLYGEGGIDTASYLGTAVTDDGPLANGLYDQLQLDLAAGRGIVTRHNADGTPTGHREGERVETIENVDATQHHDDVRGDGNANRLRGYGGDDLLDGRGGDDQLQGAGGNDTLRGGVGDDSLTGGDEADLLEAGAGRDTLDGGAGNDVLYGDPQTVFDGPLSLMQLNPGSTFSQFAIADDYDGLSGDAFTVGMVLRPFEAFQAPSFPEPVLFGYYGPVEINGSVAFTEQFRVRVGSSFGTDGDGTIEVEFGWPSRLLVTTDILGGPLFDGALHRLSVGYDATSGLLRVVLDDVLFETIVEDVAQIGPGGRLRFGQSQDPEDGGDYGAGNYSGELGDIRVWSELRTPAEISANAFRTVDSDETGLLNNWQAGEDGTTAAPIDVAGGVEMKYSKFETNEDLPLNRDDVAMVTDPSEAADVLSGGAGNDTLVGGIGDDTIEGGEGLDIAIIAASFDEISSVVENADGSLTVVSPDGTDVFSGIETYGLYDVFVPGAALLSGSISTTPTDGDDLLTGTDGDDSVIDGLGGNDTLNGLGGDDGLRGGDGDDLLVGGPGNDRLPAQAGNDTIYGGDGNDSLGGSTGNDVIYGDAGNDSGGAGPGNDRMFGGEGNDTTNGGEGNDYIDAGNGNDRAGGSFDDDTVMGGNGDDFLGGGFGDDSVVGGTGNDTVGGGGNRDTIFGGTGDDVLNGGNGSDSIFDEDGRDRINPGTGNDTVTGGADADQFVFNAFSGSGQTVITDFTGGVDEIRVTGLLPVADQLSRLNMTETMFEGQVSATFDYGKHSVIVQNVAAITLGAEDFLFG